MALESERKILVINPNTTQAMTDAVKHLISSLQYSTTYEYFTAPSGVPSINNEDDAVVSASHCLPALEDKLSKYNAFLVCCYSHHPLVSLLRSALNDQNLHATVTGIFEASVAISLQSINIDEKFGIVSTGSQWEGILGEAVSELLGSSSSTRYAGTETTGLNANELHSAPEAEVARRMKEATKRLLDKRAVAICLGCAGMAGMNRTVREACVEQLGEQAGQRVKIVDGVVAGSIFLEGALRAGL
ncbi:related to hydantoin racemase (Dcg1) [Ramularia collo-cygni]|uniref:Related to hydantoin racemase (Dcg1) n=1 Tax=Ramularia collo-cygni TaxID=112498 RepID=A0A2D3UUV1_9PEZI|nr:related to hydantoin racemase (Dcg1) [Ramularia collo-cygni]CZT16760.1 related to hydantoin racemase (Dcg1) [Ramularia collo-cygni]